MGREKKEHASDWSSRIYLMRQQDITDAKAFFLLHGGNVLTVLQGRL
jgi:hypothetical protein